MLTNIFLSLTGRSPKIRRVAFSMLFEYVARRSRDFSAWTHMNYGYADGPGHGHTIALDPKEEAERYCHQLYHHVVVGIDLTGKDVVEVSCGRGGGSAFVHRYHCPRTLTGIDIAHAAVGFCRRVHHSRGLRFVQGDAEDLPVFDDSVDAVINVEASFCYGEIERFFAEVRRVLRPGGYFLYADLRLAEELDDLMAALHRSGLDMLAREDITAGVIRALDLDAERRESDTRANSPWFLRHAMGTFAGAPGTRIPTLLGQGRMRYFRILLRKPDHPIPPAASAVRSVSDRRSAMPRPGRPAVAETSP
jgi:SAM-dependent methyltransferase